MSRIIPLCVVMCCLSAGFAQLASTDTPPAANAGVPGLMSFSSTLRDANGKPVTGVIGVTFLLYKDQQGGSPLWMETQNVQPDKGGHYSVLLGSTTSSGLPQDVFVSGEARWLGVQVVGQEEQPRVVLAAVPYSLKAGDAETIGGLPASAFVLASGTKGSATSVSAGTSSGATPTNLAPAHAPVTGKGVVNFVPLWDKTSDIVDSLIFQKNSQIGINTKAPAATFDVNGKSDIRDTLTLFPKATDSTLAISGTTFKIDGTGNVTFISGQTFPGTGTITGVTTASGSGLSGGGTSGTLNLSLLTSCSSGQTLGWNGSAWICQTAGGSGTVTSVGLSAPASDFMVSGSPVTSSGTLGLNWNVAPTNTAMANAIVKRDSTGSFSATDISAGGALTAASSLAVGGNTYLGGYVGIGTHNPQALLNLDFNGNANSDTFLVGNTTKGMQLRDTGGAVDLESLGAPLFINYATGASTYLFNLVGIGTSNPQVELNLNQGDNANNDALLIGNSSTKGLQLRDTGTGVDLESIGVPLYVNNVTQQPVYMNANGGTVNVGNFLSYAALAVGAVVQPNGVYLSAEFSNDVTVYGNFYAVGTKNFRIDHPLDPTNKYLNHAAIESSEVLNQYSGNAVLDGEGKGRVEFPAWFAAINDDFRYQLTAIGAPGPNLYVAEEIQGNSFTIAGGRPGMKVSWQVTARRNDAYMKAHPYVVEQDKPERERGYYIDPELYGAPKEQGLQWARQIDNKPETPTIEPHDADFFGITGSKGQESRPALPKTPGRNERSTNR
ncbi:MAG TPA: hypothetical protein VNZ03_12390 [Terriglobales bacterium]|nr:hypothetical protein [Terriglobales bacterium]